MVMQVTIDGMDVTSYCVLYSTTDSLYELIDTAQLLVDFRVASLIPNLYGKTVLITEGITSPTERYIFRGDIRGINNKTITYELDCKNKMQQLADREADVTFDSNIDVEAGKFSEIAKFLVTEDDFGGLNGDGTTFQDSGTTHIIKQYRCNHDKIFERVVELADIIDWQVYYKASDDKVYFEQLGRTTNANVLRFNTSGTTNIMEIPKYDKDATGIITRVKINGVRQIQTYTQSFAGTGAQTAFDLSYSPSESTKVTVDGVIKARYQLGGPSTSGDYYVDVLNQQVVFTTAPAGAAAIIIEYGSLRPTTVEAINEDAERDYLNSTEADPKFVEQTYTFTDLYSVDDAQTRADGILAKVSKPLISAVLKVAKNFGAVYPGEQIRVIDTVNNIDQYFIVRNVTRHYPEPYDEISIGDDRLFKRKTPQEIEDRIAKLEKQMLENTGILVQTRKGDDTLTVDLMNSDLYTISATGTLWGTGTWNTTSTSVWNVNGLGASVLSRRVWPNDIFWEDCADNAMIDMSNTDATIDTTNQQMRADL